MENRFFSNNINEIFTICKYFIFFHFNNQLKIKHIEYHILKKLLALDILIIF